MTPPLEFGLGLISGFAATAFVFWAVNSWRGKKTFTQKETLALLKFSERILNEIDAPCLIIDSTAAIKYANQTAREFDGTNKLYAQATETVTQTRVLEAISSNRTITIEPASNDYLRLRIIPLAESHAIVFVSDTSTQARIIAMRRDFITNMSHELKTPIAAISLLSDALTKAAEDPETVRRFSNRLQTETRRLDNLSRDIIKLSEAQAPIEKDERTTASLEQILIATIEQHTELADENLVKINYSKKLKKKDRALIHVRESAISAALSNLIVNAIEHSPAQEIITVTLDKTKTHYTVIVKDNGPGITAAHQDRIFERFFRADESRSRKLGGSGLGLSIVRNAARTHGGEVTVDSTPNEGATFTLTLPTARKVKN